MENIVRKFSLLYKHFINSSGLVSGTRLQSTGEMSAKPCDVSSSTNSENTNPETLWHVPKHSKIPPIMRIMWTTPSGKNATQH